MSTTEEFNILIITDPRSAGVREFIKPSLLNHYTPDMTLNVEAVTTQSGLLSYQIQVAKDNELKDGGKYDFLYLLGGNEHMVCVDSETIISPYGWVGEFVDKMYDQLFETRNTLFEVTYRPVICELIGLNFAECNATSEDVSSDSQQTTDQGILHLNRAIASLNKDIDVISPWFGTTLHSIIHHKLHHKYRKLEDGYYLNEDLQKTWATLLAKSMVKNCGWIEKL